MIVPTLKLVQPVMKIGCFFPFCDFKAWFLQILQNIVFPLNVSHGRPTVHKGFNVLFSFFSLASEGFFFLDLELLLLAVALALVLDRVEVDSRISKSNP